MKQILPDIKRIILANVNAKLYSCTHKVVQQQS